jgi:TonB-linked SusC/RagA family outer membrane protein
MKLKQLNKSIMRGILVFFALLPLLATAQSKYTFKGTIKDASTGEGLIGATVNIGGTFQGAVADENGMYDLSGAIKPGRYSLIFNYVGYTAKVVAVEVTDAGGAQTIDAELGTDAMNLDQVVVTGSTLSSTRRQLGNAITTVDGAALAKSGTGNALAALQGRVAGARITQTSGDPAGGININLRGINSLSGGSDPLYVIDGVISSNDATAVSQTGIDAGAGVIGTNRMADINPNDIANISVLNGAAAAAIYGSRAANGVVIITTKRGEAGKPKITVGTSVSMNQLRKRVYITKYGKQFGYIGQEATDKTPATLGKGLSMIGNAAATEITANPGVGLKVDTLTRNNAKAFLYSNLVDVTRYDYQDQIFQDGMGTDNFINISGGTEKTKYFMGASYMKNEGIIRNTDFNRIGLRLNVDQVLSSWASLSLGLNYTNSYANELPNGNVFYSPINGMTITGNVFDITKTDANGNYKGVEVNRINPMSALETFKLNQRVNRTINNLKLSIFPMQGLKFDFIAGVDAFSQYGSMFIPVYPYPVPASVKSLGYAASNNNLSLLFNNDINATYEKTFGNISSTTVVGYNFLFNRSDYTSSSGENLLPGFTSVSGAATRATNYSLDRSWVRGYFAQQTFGYNNNLFLTIAGRIDGSSKFSKENNQQFYPKASLSYILSDLWKGQSIEKTLSSVKLRASYGEAGGLAAIGSYDRFYQYGSQAYLNKTTITPNARLANPNVRPERTREIEGGLDLGFFNNRVMLNATYYNQDVFDLLVERLLAASEGGTSIVDNVGQINNKGIELSLNADVYKTKDFNVNLFGIFNNNKNIVVKTGNSANPTAYANQSITVANSAGAPVYIVEGQPMGVFYGTFLARNADGTEKLNKYKVPQTDKGTVTKIKKGETIPAGGWVIGDDLYVPRRDASGQVIETDAQLRKIIGNPNPDYTLSFGTGITWKNLTVGVMLDGVYGNQVFNADRRTRQGVGIGDLAEKELKGEVQRGWIHGLYLAEDFRIDDGSFTKLREASLSYRIPKLGKTFNDITVTLVGRNLYSWDNYNGYDPETNAGGGSDRLRGIDFGNIPVPRTYQFSVRASF